MNTENEKTKFTFTSLIKNIFFVFLILQFAPAILSNFKAFLTDAMDPKVEVGVIHIKGVISDSHYYTQQIHSFLKKDTIKGLLLKIDSPGGASGSSQAVFSELKKFKQKKPVISLVENVCTSGSYYIASASHKIIANPSSIIGHIGVNFGLGGFGLPNFQDRLKDWKISVEFIQAGKFKTAGSPFKKNSPEELALLQNVADDTYRQFLKDIAQERKISLDASSVWGDGKIFTGSQAVHLNLIDSLGSLQDAIDELKKSTGAKNDIKFVYAEKPRTLTNMFFQNETNEMYTAHFFSFARHILNVVAQWYTALESRNEYITS